MGNPSASIPTRASANSNHQPSLAYGKNPQILCWHKDSEECAEDWIDLINIHPLASQPFPVPSVRSSVSRREIVLPLFTTGGATLPQFQGSTMNRLSRHTFSTLETIWYPPFTNHKPQRHTHEAPGRQPQRMRWWRWETESWMISLVLLVVRILLQRIAVSTLKSIIVIIAAWRLDASGGGEWEDYNHFKRDLLFPAGSLFHSSAHSRLSVLKRSSNGNLEV